ncbi:hypothetical protein Taro_027946 [Colocasia esculenta]|uniref:Uncharacterized protein n=1 Tax=Colocasia esculenta TaxID=4460 RepID=A0A843VJJ4_COLES|nr:hypothetical protein [Colocasia esculenta]
MASTHWLEHLAKDCQVCKNNPQKTTGLFSFGRPKEEKLMSHHHPQLNRRVNVVNRRPLHRQQEPGGFRERLRDPVTERKWTVHKRYRLGSVFRLYWCALRTET